MALYKLIWDDFCSWYLEMIKPAPGLPLAANTYTATVGFVETLLKLLHPFMPFLTEELWHQIQHRQPQDCLIVAAWPRPTTAPATPLLDQATATFELVTALRSLRNQAQVTLKVPLVLYVAEKAVPAWLAPFTAYVKKLAHLSDIECTTTQPPDAARCSIRGTAFYLALGQTLDKDQEKARLEKELTYAHGFLASVLKQLNNECFIQHASPQVVALERKKTS